MIIISTPHLTLKTKYYFRNNGQDYYQRAIPKALRRFFSGKAKISRKLSGRHTNLALEIARLAREDDELFANLSGKSGPDAATEAQAKALLAYYGVRPGDGLLHMDVPPGMHTQPHLTDLEHYFEASAAHGTTTEADKLAKRLLTRPMPLMLSQVPEIYFEHHQKGHDSKFRRETLKRYKNLIGAIGDMAISEVTREMAHHYVKSRGRQGVKTQTIQREINTIKAALAVVIREKSLGLTNQFESLPIQGLGADSKRRLSFTYDEHRALIAACIEKGDEIRMLVLLSCLTGARIGELAGLRVEDVVLATDVPFVSITDYENRSLKTQNSRRQVPLIAVGVRALSAYLKGLDGPYLFPRYAGPDGVKNNSASVSVNNFIKTIAPNKTSHSARHAMRTLLRHADVPTPIAHEIGGWSAQSIGDSYGQGYSLAQKRDALSRALAPVLP